MGAAVGVGPPFWVPRGCGGKVVSDYALNFGHGEGYVVGVGCPSRQIVAEGGVFGS